MSTIFEKTMRACLENKEKEAKVTNKKLNESFKSLTEFYEEDQDEFKDELMMGDDELGMETDPEFEMDGISDDVVVVIDPDLDEEEFNNAAKKAQELIDGSDDGIVASDEFIGDYTYTCPICGNTFFSEDEMHDGDECPVCGDTPDGYVLIGKVAEVEGSSEDDDEDVDEEETKAETEVDKEDEEDEEDLKDELKDELEDDLEVDLPEDEEEEEEKKDKDDKKKESLERSNNHRSAHRESRKIIARKRRDLGENKAVPKKAQVSYKLDETTFNPFLNKFIHENYKNAKSFEIVGAKKSGTSLRFECKLTFKSGKTQTVVLRTENFNPKSDVIAMRDSGAFKCESSKTAPFMFKIRVNDGIIRCEGLKYNFISSLKEGKRVQVSGNLARKAKMESKRK